MNIHSILSILKRDLPDFVWQMSPSDENKIYGSFMFYYPCECRGRLIMACQNHDKDGFVRRPIEFWIKWDEQESELDSDLCEPKSTIEDYIVEIKRCIFNQAAIYAECYQRAMPDSLSSWLRYVNCLYDEDDADAINKTYAKFITQLRNGI